jgi:hypothetical protein
MHTTGAPGRTTDTLECESPSSRLTREQVVDRIISINPTATVEFLNSFKDPALGHYLDHLVATSAPRGRHARWLRHHETPAILSREPRH